MTRQLLVRGECATERGRYAEQRKQIRGDAATFQNSSAFTIRLTKETGDIVVRSERLEGVALPLPIEKVGIGTAKLVRGGDVGGGDSGRALHGIDREQLIRSRRRETPQEAGGETGETGAGLGGWGRTAGASQTRSEAAGPRETVPAGVESVRV